MDNKGQVLGLTVLLAWKFLIILLLILFVVITLSPVFTAKQDIRQNEAMILAKSIVDCASKQGTINPDFKIEDCVNLDSKEYYVNISVSSLDSEFKKEVTFGSSLQVACESIEKYTTNKPACLKQRYYILVNNNGKTEKGILDLLVGIRRFNENQ